MTCNVWHDDDAAWDTFVRSHPRGTFFHLSGWSRAIERALKHRVYHLKVCEGSTILGVLPIVSIKSRLFGHALLSNAFAVAGGPLGTSAEIEQELLNQACKLARGLNADYVELKDTQTTRDGWQERADLYSGFERSIPPDEPACLTQIPRKQRAVVRKALDAGFSFTLDDSLETFHGLYARTVRDHGTPIFPKALFRAFRDAFGDACEILTVHHNNKPLSSVLSFYYGDKVLPFYTGSMPSARSNGANDFMYWQLMRQAVSRGATVFDFGRSKIGTGPHAFKKNWGFQPRPIIHQYYLNRATSLPALNPSNPKFDILINAWRRLPIPVANLIGPYISRNLG